MMATLDIKALGDQAVLAYLPDENSAIRFSAAIQAIDYPWLIDLVPAYTTVGVFYDPRQIRHAQVVACLQEISLAETAKAETGRLHRIPCCYEMELDLGRVVEHTGLSRDDVIALHLATVYRVYAIGFAPGFPYLGYLPERLCGVSRLPSPRLRVEPGSVGITARQTGIYPLARPGGWNLIGRTPLTIVAVEDDYFPLSVGDAVQFFRIDTAEYRQLEGERL